MLDLKQRLIQHASKNSIRSTTPTGSEQDDEELCTESENSNESWTTSEEFSSEYILRYGSQLNNSSPNFMCPEKPFACPVPGCKKRYKNINGIKYHSKNGHKKDGKYVSVFISNIFIINSRFQDQERVQVPLRQELQDCSRFKKPLVDPARRR